MELYEFDRRDGLVVRVDVDNAGAAWFVAVDVFEGTAGVADVQGLVVELLDLLSSATIGGADRRLLAEPSASEITHAVVRRFEAESLRSDAGFGARSIDDTLPESEDIPAVYVIAAQFPRNAIASSFRRWVHGVVMPAVRAKTTLP